MMIGNAFVAVVGAQLAPTRRNPRDPASSRRGAAARASRPGTRRSASWPSAADCTSCPCCSSLYSTSSRTSGSSSTTNIRLIRSPLDQRLRDRSARRPAATGRRREPHRERAPLPRHRDHLHAAAMAVDDLLDDVEPETGAELLASARARRAEEPREQLGLLLELGCRSRCRARRSRPRVPSVRATTSIRPPPAVNFTAFDSRFSSARSICRSSATSSMPGSMSTTSSTTSLRSSAAAASLTRWMHGREVRRAELRLELAGFEARHRHQVRDQHEQPLAVAPDDAEHAALLRRSPTPIPR